MIIIKEAVICTKCGSIFDKDILETKHYERYANNTYITDLGPPKCRTCRTGEHLVELKKLIKGIRYD